MQYCNLITKRVQTSKIKAIQHIAYDRRSWITRKENRSERAQGDYLSECINILVVLTTSKQERFLPKEAARI